MKKRDEDRRDEDEEDEDEAQEFEMTDEMLAKRLSCVFNLISPLPQYKLSAHDKWLIECNLGLFHDYVTLKTGQMSLQETLLQCEAMKDNF